MKNFLDCRDPYHARWLGAGGLALLVAYIVISNLAGIHVRHFFYADDWAWLYYSEFRTYRQLFSIVPCQIYNDRPMGAVAIKALYGLLGLNSKCFLYFQLFLHVANCVLLYFISRRYIGKLPALVAGALAGSWISANNAVFWTAAIFDLLGATLCLLSLLLWQIAQVKKPAVIFSIAGAAIYFLAIRTKEYSIGLPALLFIMGIALENRRTSQAIRLLLPYLSVMLLCGSRYLYLLFSGPSLLGATDNPYGLHLSGMFANLLFYLSNAFYFELFGDVAFVLAFLAFALAGVRSGWFGRIFLVSFSWFALMLGPTLLLVLHRDPLYLYTPHFFLALAVAALLNLGRYWRIFAAMFSLLLVGIPPSSRWCRNINMFYEVKSSMSRDQFSSFLKVTGEIARGSTIFVAGVEPYFNPFSYGPGYSVMIEKKDSSLKFVVEKPPDELKKEFCESKFPKRFVTFYGREARDETQLVSDSCGRRIPRPAKE
jgi:hypothetical protein